MDRLSSLSIGGRGGKFAPYAREISSEIAAGRTPNVFCFAGHDAWQQAKRRRENHGLGSALVLPEREAPEELVWPCLDALVLIPGNCGGDRVRRLIIALLIAGCRCVIEARPGQEPTAHYANEHDAQWEAA